MGLWKQTFRNVDIYYVTQGDITGADFSASNGYIRKCKVELTNGHTFALCRPRKTITDSYGEHKIYSFYAFSKSADSLGCTFTTEYTSNLYPTPTVETKTSGLYTNTYNNVRWTYTNEALLTTSGSYYLLTGNDPYSYGSDPTHPTWIMNKNYNNINSHLTDSEIDTVFGTTTTSINSLLNYILDNHSSATPVDPEDDDPYANIGDNDVEGGGGDFDDSSIDIDFPPTPVISVADAGFVSLLTPTLAQIQALSSYMWSTAFDETQIKKLFANPMDVFIGMSILPITIPSSSTKTISIAGINTGLVMNQADEQFVTVDFGTLTIKTGTGGSYLDYSPYTKASIFLPYIGWRDIDIDEIMGKTLQLRYCVDIVSGGCVAWLKCGGSVLYEWTGQCAINIPLTSIDFTSTASAAISAVGHIGSAIGGMISGGASGAMSGAAFGPGGAIAGAIGGGIGSAINGMAGLAQDALNAKPTYPKSGSLGGPAGVMGHQQAYICLHRPAMAKPKYQSKYMGYPSFITRKVSDLVGTGFNAFSDVRLQGLGLLDTEIAELTALLKGGVYL